MNGRKARACFFAALAASTLAANALDLDWLNALWRRSDYHAYLSDARGLTEASVVQWRGLDVGRVVRLEQNKGKVRADIVVDAEHRRGLREGVKAWASRDLLRRRPTVLQLIDTGTEEASRLKRGAEIPEAGLHETITRRQLLIAGVAFVVVLLFVLILKGIKKLILIGIVVAGLVFGGILLKQYLGGGGVSFSSASQEMQELFQKLAANPQTQAAADRLQTLLKDAVHRVSQQDASGTDRIRTEIERAFDDEAANLRETGETEGADQIERLKRAAARLLTSSEP